ncbi:hypothetical protein [Bradyrhizobium rifense]|uniref:hypothetical protein n=1 Tax=Bradyrhizobium rifense TaxID=515499 RepID=UPI001FE3236D|nr:hypothetical protein [Bradyrhizobium rifense]
MRGKLKAGLLKHEKPSATRIENPKRRSRLEEYEDLHDYILFMANTGLRPDEAKRLEFRDVKIVYDQGSRETILEIAREARRRLLQEHARCGASIPARYESAQANTWQ